MIGQAGTKEPSFIFGGNTGLSYEQLQRRKSVADALRSNALRTPRNIGEGLSAVGQALLVRSMDKKNELAATQGASTARDLIAAALQGRSTTPFNSASGSMVIDSPAPRTPEQEIGDDAMAAIGKPEAMSIEGKILNGLQTRGLPEHVAQGFVQNFRDESGLKTDINEISPLVPGSRGGYGLAQWTGPRRKQLEAFAAAQGKPVSDLDLQLDFLVNELQGSESAAGRTILSTRSTPEAATAIVNDFLRPAEQHRASRAAKYGGSSSQPPQSNYSAIYEALSSPWINQGQRAMLMAELNDRRTADARAYDSWQQQNDPMRQLQLEKMQLELDQARNPQPGFSVLTDAQEIEMGLDPAGSYQQGTDGKVSQIGGAGTNISVTTGAGEKDRFLYGSDAGLPAGWRLDRQTGQASQIPGGPAALEAAQGDQKEGNKDRQAKLKLGTTLTSLGLNLDEIEDGGLPVTGAIGDFRRTNIGRFLTGSDAVDFGNRTNQITDSAAFSEIQNMRDNSPTGGAVGQLTDKERAAIGNAVTALNNSTSAEEYTRAAKAYQKLALDIAYGEGRWQMLDDGTFEALPEGSKQTETDMSDEDLFKKYGLN